MKLSLSKKPMMYAVYCSDLRRKADRVVGYTATSRYARKAVRLLNRRAMKRHAGVRASLVPLYYLARTGQ